jgi:host factor-I protein
MQAGARAALKGGLTLLPDSSTARRGISHLTPAASVYNISMAFRGQGNSNSGKRGRTPPPEETFEEAGFLKALGEKQKLVSIKLMDGQVVTGWVEYYDKGMVRLTREGAPNLFIFKHEIMYIAEDGGKKK